MMDVAASHPIPCPVESCPGQIIIITTELLRGAQFGCTVCGASVGIAPESKETLSHAMVKFEQLATDMKRLKADNDGAS